MTCFVEDMIHIAEDEDRLFESLLKVEFRKAEVLRESDGINSAQNNDVIDAEVKEAPADNNKENANDEVKKKVSERIKSILLKFFNAVKGLGEKIMNKIKQFIFSDNKLVEKYLAVLKDNNNLQGFEGIDNFSEPNLDWEFDDNNIGTFLAPMEKVIDKTYFQSNMRDFNYIAHNDTNKADEIIMACNSALKKPIDNWNKDGSANFDWNKAVTTLKDGKLTKPVFKIVRKLSGIIGTLNGIDAKTFYSGNLADSSLTEYINNSRDIAKKVFGTHVKYFKSIRQALVVCGTYALKKSSAKSTDATGTQLVAASANMLAYMSGHKSEMYLDEQFEFV